LLAKKEEILVEAEGVLLNANLAKGRS